MSKLSKPAAGIVGTWPRRRSGSRAAVPLHVGDLPEAGDDPADLEPGRQLAYVGEWRVTVISLASIADAARALLASLGTIKVNPLLPQHARTGHGGCLPQDRPDRQPHRRHGRRRRAQRHRRRRSLARAQALGAEPGAEARTRALHKLAGASPSAQLVTVAGVMGEAVPKPRALRTASSRGSRDVTTAADTREAAREMRESAWR